MPSVEPVAVLKRNAKRTVSLVREGASVVVVKSFHAPGRLDRLRDLLRARREARALRRLLALGLPVPRPLAVRRREGRWELVLERLEGANLDEILAGRAPWPAPPGRVAVALGRLYAGLRRAGARAGDLHAGNVLIAPDGRAQLVDVARISRLRPDPVHPALVRLAAGVRERSSGIFRARFLLAYLRAAGGPSGAARRALVEGLEADARQLRRALVAARVPRWWRESGDTRRLDAGGVAGLAARELDDASCARLIAGEGSAAPAGREVERVGPTAARARWELAALLRMHHVEAAARPLVTITAPRAETLLARPAGAHPLEEAWCAAPPVDRALLAHSAGAALGALDDRGLALVPVTASGLLASPEGRVSIGPGRLVDLVRPDPTGAAACLFEELAPRPSAVERAAFGRGFVDVHRGTAAERRRLARELGLG